MKHSVVILRDADGGPLLAEVGQDLSLLCNYQVMGDSLYSIKWYRDDKEFFRYIPRGNQTYSPVTCLSPGIELFLVKANTYIQGGRKEVRKD